MTEEAPKKRGRGRPPGENPRSATERKQQWIDELKAAGGMYRPIAISPEANQAIHSLMEHKGYSDVTETINTTLVTAAKRIKK